MPCDGELVAGATGVTGAGVGAGASSGDADRPRLFRAGGNGAVNPSSVSGVIGVADVGVINVLDAGAGFASVVPLIGRASELPLLWRKPKSRSASEGGLKPSVGSAIVCWFVPAFTM